MGSLFKPDIPAPPPPPPPQRIRDEINRVEQVPVKNPDGSTTFVTRELPLSEAEQAEKAELKRVMQESLAEIERLSSDDYAEDETTRKALDAWEAERKSLLEDDFINRQREEEKRLAQRGLGDSTAALNIRRQRRADERKEKEQIDRERDVLASDMRSTNIQQQQNLYSLAANAKNADDVRRQQSALQGQSMLSSINQSQRASLNDYYRAQLAQTRSPLGNLAETATSIVPGFSIFNGGLRGIF